MLPSVALGAACEENQEGVMGILSVLFGGANANKARRARDEQFAAQKLYHQRKAVDRCQNDLVWEISAEHPKGHEVCRCCGRA